VLLGVLAISSIPPGKSSMSFALPTVTPQPIVSEVKLEKANHPTPQTPIPIIIPERTPTNQFLKTSPSPQPFITATPNEKGAIEHLVNNGETIDSIAALYRTSPEELRRINWMAGNAILPSQSLLVSPGSDWLPKNETYGALMKDIESGYPITLDWGNFRLHYQPRTYPAIDPAAVAKLIETGLRNDEVIFKRSLAAHFDVYVSGVFFEYPNQHLRGRSFSKDLYLAMLHDGSGDATDQAYLAAHEMTHLYMWNTFGQPYSFLVSDGSAVYAGFQVIRESNRIPLIHFCKALEIGGKLPQISDDELTYRGQNYDLENYFAAGCFVNYLVDAYGVEKLGLVYSSNDYAGIYGKTLMDLESEWKTDLASRQITLNFDPQQLIETNLAIKNAYYDFFSGVFTVSNSLPSYLALDGARLAMLEGRLEVARNLLDQYWLVHP